MCFVVIKFPSKQTFSQRKIVANTTVATLVNLNEILLVKNLVTRWDMLTELVTFRLELNALIIFCVRALTVVCCHIYACVVESSRCINSCYRMMNFLFWCDILCVKSIGVQTGVKGKGQACWTRNSQRTNYEIVT